MSQRSAVALFLPPGYPSVLAVQDPRQLFEDLVNIEMVAMLNEAFCELHHKPYCPPSEELTRECGKVTFLALINSDSLCMQWDACEAHKCTNIRFLSTRLTVN